MVWAHPSTGVVIQSWVDNVAATSQHKDSNGAALNHGDTVVLIKDLPVKGAGFTAKRGTAERDISLVSGNLSHIEGRVEGQRIVILTEFVKSADGNNKVPVRPWPWAGLGGSETSSRLTPGQIQFPCYWLIPS